MKTLWVACTVALLATVGVADQSAARVADDAVPAMIVLETLPADPELANGGLVVRGFQWSTTRIALQPARFARGAVVEKWAGKGVLAWTLVGDVQRDANGRLMLDVPPERHAWCDIPTFEAVIAVCYQDLDGDGALDTRLRGWFGAPRDPLSVSRLDSPEKIAPLAYRVAAPEELPQYRIGYESCVSKPGEQLNAQSELRYSTLVLRANDRFLPDKASAQCSEVAKLIEQREDGSGIFQFGRFKVQVAKQEDRFNTSLIEGITPGTLIGNVRADRPLTDAVDATAPAESSGGKPFLYAVSAPRISSAPVALRGELLSMEVAHGITGTLAAEARSRGWSKTITLPVGTPMYGAEMTQTSGPGSFDAEVVWCAPQADEKGKELSWCFLRGQAGTMLESNRRPYVLEYISSSGGRGIDAPVVTRGPVDFGAPLILRISFERISAKRVDLLWSVGKEPSANTDRLSLRRGKDGRASFLLGGVIVTIVPSADGKTVTAEGAGEFKTEMPGMPMDVARLSGGG